MKGNAKVIHFHIKSRGVEGFFFVQVKFEKCTLNVYLESEEVGVKTTIADLQPLLA